VQQIFKAHRIEGLLNYDYEYQAHTLTSKGRYQITAVKPISEAIEQALEEFGWRAYVTNAPRERLSLPQAVLTYRDEWIHERSFHRLKGVALSITPFFVQRDDQVQGLVHLLSLAVRLLTVMEFVVRRHLQTDEESLVGLSSDHPKQSTSRPTAERLLKAFDNLTLTRIYVRGQWYGDVTPLSYLQRKILRLLGLSPVIYSDLVENST
jgi:transposase